VLAGAAPSDKCETMNQLPPELAEEAPLDPAAERVRRKMVRLLAVSIGIMFVGIFAVLAAIVWQMGEATRTTLVDARIALPEAFAVAETDLSADAIMVRGTGADGAMMLLVFDRATGAMTARYTLGAAPSER